MHLVLPIVVSVIISWLFWLLATIFLGELKLKPFKLSIFCTLTSLGFCLLLSPKLEAGIISVILILTVATILISSGCLLLFSFYKSFVQKGN